METPLDQLHLQPHGCLFRNGSICKLLCKNYNIYCTKMGDSQCSNTT